MGKTIALVSHNDCTGCGACFNICPAGAISMTPDREGFLFPAVNTKKCILCSKCISVCEVQKRPPLQNDQDCYAIALKNEDIRKKSSSGGAFGSLADHVLGKGGMVCGAVYSKDYKNVFHAWAGNKEELAALRGSKYVQSDTGSTFREAQEYLKEGKYVLYSGTPCQIYGLQCFLGKDYEKLITVDIVCHGVPSPEIYKRYLDDITGNKKILKVDFRDKSRWGWGTATSVYFTDGSTYCCDCYRDPYWKAFLGGLSTRKSCGQCRFANIHRIGDFSIGDFWGVAELDADCDDGKGTSLLLANNSKAKAVFQELREPYSFCKPFSIDSVYELAKKKNGQLIGPKKPHELRQPFFDEIAKTSSFADAYHSVTKIYDVGYIGWWDSKNYGSALTSFAMNRTLKKMGKSVLMIEHPGMKPGSVTEQSYGMQFARKYYDCSEITGEGDYNRYNYSCNSFIVGSDQLWNWWNIRSNADYYFLDFAWKDRKKIAYATSFGMDHTAFPEYMKIRAGYYLSRFDFISTREKSGVSICKNVFGVEAEHVLDPVFLCPINDYLEVIRTSKKRMGKPYLFSYILDPTEDKLRLVQETAKKRGLDYIIAIDGLGKEDFIKGILKNDSNILAELRIEEWLSYIYYSSYVVTDSFHGLCFSTIFKKQVIAYVNAHRGEERFISITDLLKIRDRLVYSLEEASEKRLADTEMDYEAISQIIDDERHSSMNWLKNALESPKKEMPVMELNRWKIREHDKLLHELGNNSGEINAVSLVKKLNDLEQRIRELENRKPEKVSVLIKNGLKAVNKHGWRDCIRYVRKEGLHNTVKKLRKN